MIPSKIEMAALVRTALAEDIGAGDITAALIPDPTIIKARILSREPAIICGVEYVNEVFLQLDPNVTIDWLVRDGDRVLPDEFLCFLQGRARSLLSGERCALNFLQTLSATATVTRQYVEAIAGTSAKLLDTRKTIPGLRAAQKYAVQCGGGHNHRMGLYDAFLIKENHIMACGSIKQAIITARQQQADKQIEVEVESFAELQEALAAKADIVLLDNFQQEQLKEAVAINAGQAKLEVSGGVSLKTIRAIAETGVDYISVGSLTKDIKAIDLSMRFFSGNR